MRAPRHDLILTRNRAFELEIILNRRLVGLDVLSEIRAQQSVSSELLARFTVTMIDIDTGHIRLSVTRQQVDAISPSSGYWDLVLTSSIDPDGSDALHYIWGSVSIVGSVTRIPVEATP